MGKHDNSIVLPEGQEPTEEQRQKAVAEWERAMREDSCSCPEKAEKTGNRIWSYHGPRLGWAVCDELKTKEKNDG